MKSASQKWYEANRAKASASRAKWREANPEKDRAATAKWREANKGRISASNRKYREENKEKCADIVRSWRYGTDGRALFDLQKGRCGVCETDLMALPAKKRHLDHCHSTGKVRGWLCGECNLGVGRFKDDPALLEAAASYLRRKQ